jgi:hypothetical protein
MHSETHGGVACGVECGRLCDESADPMTAAMEAKLNLAFVTFALSETTVEA